MKIFGMKHLNKEYGNIETSLDYFLKFNIPKNAKILDIGCSYGSLIFNLQKRGYKNIYGIDIISEFINEGKKKYPDINKKIILYSGKHIPFKDKKFDVILMFDVIEHIPKVQEFLKKEVYRVLKKKGLFIFQTPNKIINIPWEIINNKSFMKWKDYHCSLQTKDSLRKILEQSGFKNIIIEKNTILTKHNKNKVKKRLGFFGLLILYLLQKMPLCASPNFWGEGKK